MPKRILDVGQCGFRRSRLKRLLQTSLNVEVDVADTADEAVSMIQSDKYDLVLINRVFNEDGGSGLDLIGQLEQSDDAPPLMLVSDREDAQKQAVAIGALPGFGKAQLNEPQTIEVIRQAIQQG